MGKLKKKKKNLLKLTQKEKNMNHSTSNREIKSIVKNVHTHTHAHFRPRCLRSEIYQI